MVLKQQVPLAKISLLWNLTRIVQLQDDESKIADRGTMRSALKRLKVHSTSCGQRIVPLNLVAPEQNAHMPSSSLARECPKQPGRLRKLSGVSTYKNTVGFLPFRKLLTTWEKNKLIYSHFPSS